MGASNPVSANNVTNPAILFKMGDTEKFIFAGKYTVPIYGNIKLQSSFNIHVEEC